jgi:peroxin-1
VSPDVDFNHLANATEGFSGADLQALLYNAHLEVVHASVGEISASAALGSGGDDSSNTKDRDNDIPIEYTSFGGLAQDTVKSRAEQMAMQRRVRRYLITFFFSFRQAESDFEFGSFAGF